MFLCVDFCKDGITSITAVLRMAYEDLHEWYVMSRELILNRWMFTVRIGEPRARASILYDCINTFFQTRRISWVRTKVVVFFNVLWI